MTQTAISTPTNIVEVFPIRAVAVPRLNGFRLRIGRGAAAIIGGEWPSKRGNIIEWPDRATYEAFRAEPSGGRRGVTARGQVGIEG